MSRRSVQHGNANLLDPLVQQLLRLLEFTVIFYARFRKLFASRLHASRFSPALACVHCRLAPGSTMVFFKITYLYFAYTLLGRGSKFKLRVQSKSRRLICQLFFILGKKRLVEFYTILIIFYFRNTFQRTYYGRLLVWDLGRCTLLISTVEADSHDWMRQLFSRRWQQVALVRRLTWLFISEHDFLEWLILSLCITPMRRNWSRLQERFY